MKRKLLIVLLLISTLLCLFSASVYAHSGRTDENGGHYDSSTGKYHYHHGYPEHYHTNGKCPYAYENRVNYGGNDYYGTSSGSSVYNDTVSVGAVIGLVICFVLGLSAVTAIAYALKNKIPYLGVWLNDLIKIWDGTENYGFVGKALTGILWWFCAVSSTMMAIFIFLFFSPFLLLGFVVSVVSFIKNRKSNKEKQEEKKEDYFEIYAEPKKVASQATEPERAEEMAKAETRNKTALHNKCSKWKYLVAVFVVFLIGAILMGLFFVDWEKDDSGPKEEPRSGTVLYQTSAIGLARMTIKASPDYSYFVKLKSPSNDLIYSFYVRAGDEITIKVPHESFYVYFAAGTTWYGESRAFGENGFYFMDGTQYDAPRLTYTFHYAQGGIMTETRSDVIDEPFYGISISVDKFK